GRDIALPHPSLHHDCTRDRLNDAREFAEDAITGRLHDTALVFRYFGLDQFAAMGSEPCQGAGLVLSHESAITGYIGGEDGRESALDPLSAQMLPPGLRPVDNPSRLI